MNSQIEHALGLAGSVGIETLREEALASGARLRNTPRLSRLTSLGGYPLLYFGSDEDEPFIYPICVECASSCEYGADRGNVTLTGAAVYEEGPDLECALGWACEPGTAISSAYGDPDAASE